MAEGTHAGAIHTDIRHMVLLKRNTFFLSSACQGLFFFIPFESSSTLTGTPEDEGRQRERECVCMSEYGQGLSAKKILCFGSNNKGHEGGHSGQRYSFSTSPGLKYEASSTPTQNGTFPGYAATEHGGKSLKSQFRNQCPLGRWQKRNRQTPFAFSFKRSLRKDKLHTNRI